MSIHPDRAGWRVKYRLPDGTQKNRNFKVKTDARSFDNEMTRRLQLGPVLAAELDRKTMTFDDFVRGAWGDHAATLSPRTQALYAWALESYAGTLPDQPLLTLDVPTVTAHQAKLLKDGVKPSTIVEAMRRLSSIAQEAVRQGVRRDNPFDAVRPVKVDARAERQVLTPIELEDLLERFTGRNRVIALLGGHQGFRPMEIRLVPWRNLSEKIAIGKTHTKPSAKPRTITVPTATALALKAWRLESGARDLDQPIVGELSEAALKLWGKRHLRPTVEAVTGGRITDASVYTLRHSHASALHYAGYTVPEAARRMGHGAVLHIQTYAHVIDGFAGERYDDLDALITAARAELMFRHCSASEAGAAAGETA
jgi:integrase